jgi:hypothetical protein
MKVRSKAGMTEAAAAVHRGDDEGGRGVEITGRLISTQAVRSDQVESQVAEQIDPALAEHATAIRALGKRVVGDVIEIGRRLADCKARVGHGGWLPWLHREFGWDERTAQRYVSIYEMAGNYDNLSDLNVPVSSLYLLAAPSTPEEARATVIERAETGEAVPVEEVKRVIQEARQGEAEQAKLESRGEIVTSETRVDTRGRRQPGSKPATGRGGAARPRSPRPVTRRRPAVAPLNSLSWSEASKEERERFVSNVGFESLWSHAPPEFRELARAELLATPLALAGEGERIADGLDAAKDDPMAIPAALKRTPPTDRFGRQRPEPGSLLKPDKKRGGR